MIDTSNESNFNIEITREVEGVEKMTITDDGKVMEQYRYSGEEDGWIDKKYARDKEMTASTAPMPASKFNKSE